MGGEVPAAGRPTCSADGEGGGEGGRLVESSTAEGEKRERERGREMAEGRGRRRDMDGGGVRKEALMRHDWWRKIPASSGI